jgi:hypothetical protein
MGSRNRIALVSSPGVGTCSAEAQRASGGVQSYALTPTDSALVLRATRALDDRCVAEGHEWERVHTGYA